MIRYARLPAILTLITVLAPGTILVCARYSDAANAGASQLAAIEAKIRDGTGTADDWRLYAEKLKEAQQFSDAEWAYRQLLDMEPSNQDARLQWALCTARIPNNDKGFEACIKSTIAAAPRLAVEILKRPESQPYLADVKFQALQREAIAQSMD